MTKYKEYVKKMLASNKEEFEAFKRVHDEYALNQDKLQDEFNKAGEKIMSIVQEWENRLCLQSEKGGYGVFTSKLAEKFREEIKKDFPLFDYIGLRVQKTITEPAFVLKKIRF